MRVSSERCDDVNCVRADAVEGKAETDDATGSCLGDGEIVVMSDVSESLRECSSLRGIRERDVDVIRGQLSRNAAFGGLQLGANRNFGSVAGDFLSGGDDFAGDAEQFSFRKGFFAAAGEKQHQGRGKGREYPDRSAQLQIYAASCGCKRRSWAAFFSTVAPPCKISMAFFTTGSSGEELGTAAGWLRSACAIRSSIEGCTSTVGPTPSVGIFLLPGV